MSHLTYCLQIVAENPPTPQQHCHVAVASRHGEHRKIISRTLFSPKKIHRKILGKKTKITDLAMTVI